MKEYMTIGPIALDKFKAKVNELVTDGWEVVNCQHVMIHDVTVHYPYAIDAVFTLLQRERGQRNEKL